MSKALSFEDWLRHVADGDIRLSLLRVHDDVDCAVRLLESHDLKPTAADVVSLAALIQREHHKRGT